MSIPIRVQRKRTKGFKLPENTVCVTRGTKWGNPFKPEQFCGSVQDAVLAYKGWLSSKVKYNGIMPPTLQDIENLRGKNLACFCRLDQHCHADVLLKLANNN